MGLDGVGPTAREKSMTMNRALALDDINLTDMEFWTLPWETREAAFQLLRSDRPIAFFDENYADIESIIDFPPGPGYYPITRYADIVEISRHPEIYCSGQSGSTIPDMPTEFLEFVGSMINMDDPRHSRLRRIVSAGFNPRMVRAVEDSIQSIAENLVNEAAEKGEFDFTAEVASRLPLKVLCDMM